MKFLIGLYQVMLVFLKLIGEISLSWLVIFWPILGYLGFCVICTILAALSVKHRTKYWCSGLGSVMGLVSNLGGKIKEVPGKIKEFVNKPRALTRQGKLDQDFKNKLHNLTVNFADNLEKSAISYANDPVYLDANWQNQEDMIYKRAWEMSIAAENAEKAAKIGAKMKKEYASRNPFFPERTPVYSRIEHNVPYYIAGTNEDLATEVF